MKPFVVVIAGGSAAGKGTLAEALQSALGPVATTLSMDRHMRRDDPEAPHFFFRHLGESWFDANHPDSLNVAAILKDIAEVETPAAIVEGHLGLAIPEIRDQADLKLFIDLAADIRAVRRIERDMRIGRSGGDPALIAAYYLECARVGHERFIEPSRHFADLIVRGDAEPGRSAQILAATIQSLIVAHE